MLRGMRSVLDFLPRGLSLTEDVWRTRHTWFVRFLWLHALGVGAFAAIQGHTVGESLAFASVLSAFALLGGMDVGGHRFRASVISFGYALASGLLVHLSGGYIELHFHYFVMVSFLVLYQDWVPFLVSIGFVGLQHGLMGTLMPHSVFNHPDAVAHPWKWAGIHAIFLGAASLGCILAWRAIERTVEQLERALHERHQADAAVKASEERYRSVIESVHDAILSADSMGTIRFWNRGARVLFGYEEREVMGKPLTLLMPERYRNDHLQGLERMRNSGESHVIGKTVALHGLKKGGEEFPLELSLSAWKTNGTLAYTGIIRDITERKRAEEERDRFFSLSLDMLCIAKSDGYFKRVSPAFTKTLGWSVEEMLARPFLDFVHPDDHAATLREVERQVVAGEQVLQFENRYRHKDGSWRTLSWKSVPQPDGTMYATARDITEHKWAEEALRKSEEKYRTLFDSVDVSVCTIKMLFDGNDKPVDYRFLEVNPSFEKLTGIQNARGRRMREIAPQHEEHWFEIYGKVALTGESVRFENQAAQLHRWYDVYAFRVGEPKERQVAIHFKDITKRKRVEEEIQTKTEQLAAANKELEAFSYSVSHDLRAPLRHVNGFTELLQKHVGSVLDEKGQRYLKTIADSVKQMGLLIDDLLAFSKMSRTELHFMTVNLEQLVKQVLDELKPETDGRRIAWTIGALPEICGDRTMLRQALINLLGNAVKYTRPRDQARIEIGALPPALSTGERGNGEGEIVIFVRDNGVGFDMQYAHKLFGVFQRLHGATEFEGTGIGLALVQRIIHRHGGRIWADSVVDKGATFYFSFPAQVGSKQEAMTTNES